MRWIHYPTAGELNWSGIRWIEFPGHTPSVRVDQDCRRDSGVGRAILCANF